MHSSQVSYTFFRVHVGEKLDMLRKNEWRFMWLTDPPLFEHSEEENALVAMHHPFTSPRIQDEDLLESEPERVLARAYDVVLNGVELGGGSIRIHRSDLQERCFKALVCGSTNGIPRKAEAVWKRHSINCLTMASLDPGVMYRREMRSYQVGMVGWKHGFHGRFKSSQHSRSWSSTMLKILCLGSVRVLSQTNPCSLAKASILPVKETAPTSRAKRAMTMLPPSIAVEPS